VVPRSALPRLPRTARPPSALYPRPTRFIVFNHDLEGLSTRGRRGLDPRRPVGAAGRLEHLLAYGCGSNGFWCAWSYSSWTGDRTGGGYGTTGSRPREFREPSGAPSPYTLSFKLRMNVQSGFDRGYVEVSHPDEYMDHAGHPDRGGDDGAGPSAHLLVTIPIRPSRLKPASFRFRFVSNSSGSSEGRALFQCEGWMIDDVTVKGGVFDVASSTTWEAGWDVDAFHLPSSGTTGRSCRSGDAQVARRIRPRCQSNDVSGALVPRLDTSS